MERSEIDTSQERADTRTPAVLDLAIVGAGIMGANHGRIARGLPGVRVAVVVDPDPERGRALAARLDARWCADLGDAPSFDAAVVAAPTSAHRELGEQLLSDGIPTLIEKPLALNVDDARALVEAARRTDTFLTVGHVEQFNTAVQELDRLLTDVIHIHADRLSPYSPRVQEGVVLDLMIHDLDIVRRISGAPVASVQAMARPTRSDQEDVATAILAFENGVTATLTASRIAQQKIRRLEITERDAFVVADLLRQDVTVHRVSHDEYVSSDGARYRQSGVIEIPFLERRGEPLALELEHFLDCVRKTCEPRVSGEDGLATLELALEVIEAAGLVRIAG